MPFKLYLFRNGLPASVVTTPGGSLLQFEDERVLLNQLPVEQQDDSSSDDTFFKRGSVYEPPANTPVYDFALNRRQLVQATLALYHPSSKAQAAGLVTTLGASPEDPLHLFFFVGNEDRAAKYSNRADGEKFEGALEVNLSPEQGEGLQQNAVQDFSDAKLIAIANLFDVDCPTVKTRKRGDPTLTDTGKVRAPVKAIKMILGKLNLPPTGSSLETRWERLVEFSSNLAGGEGLAFDSRSIVQHVIAVVPCDPNEDKKVPAVESRPFNASSVTSTSAPIYPVATAASAATSPIATAAAPALSNVPMEAAVERGRVEMHHVEELSLEDQHR